MSAPPPHTATVDTDALTRTSRTVRVTVALLFAAWLIDYADRLVINLVLPSLGNEFNLSHGQQGLIVSAFFLSYALGQIPGGLLADRFGARRIALLALFVWSIFTALTGFAWSFVALLGVRFAFGAAEGIFPPASMKLLVERTTPERRMGANGLVMSSNAIAGVLTPLAVTPLIAAFGWRSAFFSMAALGILVITAMRLGLPRPLPHSEPDPGQARPALLDVLRIGVIWRFSLIMFGYNVIGWGLATWVPSYLSEERGVPLSSAGPIMALPYLAAAVATVVGGRLCDRLGGHQRKVIVPGMIVAAAMLPLMAFSSSLTGFAVFSSLAVFGASLAYMPIFAVPLRALPPSLVGVGSAVIVFGGQVAGMVVPPVMGLIADAFSFEMAFLALAIGAVLAAVMGVLTPQDPDTFRTAVSAATRHRTDVTMEKQ